MKTGDRAFQDQLEIANWILYDKAGVLATAIPDCRAEDLQDTRKFVLEQNPSFLRVRGRSGAAGLFVGLFGARTGRRTRKMMFFIGALSLCGKVLKVGQWSTMDASIYEERN